jgi:hypothetical protein
MTTPDEKDSEKQDARSLSDLPPATPTPEEAEGVKGGAFNGFVNFGDIKGESTDKDHKDWVMILKYDNK